MTMRDQGTKSPAKLPRLLRRFFWDYDFNALSWERDRDFIFRKLLPVIILLVMSLRSSVNCVSGRFLMTCHGKGRRCISKNNKLRPLACSPMTLT